MNEAVAAPALRPRNAWIAAIGAYFMAPVAFAYVQRLRWGIAFSLAGPLLLFVLARTGLIFLPWVYTGMAGLSLAILVTTIVYAVRFARDVPAGAAPRWYNRWYHYLWIGVLTTAFAYVMGNARGAVFGEEPFRIPSINMAPTLQLGDFIVADFRAGTMETIERGDIVIFTPTRHPDQRWVQRVVALPGETIDAREHHVRIDGKPLDEPWQTLRDGPALPGEFEQVKLGPDEYYLMGDNRPNSEDSRYAGPVRRSALIAKARTIWFHYSPVTHSIDTSRIGPIAAAPAR